METFALVIWLYVGLRYEEARIEGLDRDTCAERLDVIERSRHLAFQQKVDGRKEPTGACIDPKGNAAPACPYHNRPPQICARHPCGSPVLPGGPRDVITPRNIKRI